MEKYTEKNGHTTVILDEAQRYFPTDFRDEKSVKGGANPEPSCFYFFEYHRHIGVDIYLLGQLWSRFNPQIVNLCEYQIDAQKRTLSLGNELSYKFMSGFDVIGSTRVLLDKKITALYHSVDSSSEHKGKELRPVRKLILLIVLMLVAVVVSFKYFFGTFVDRGKPKIEGTAPAPDAQAVAVAGAAGSRRNRVQATAQQLSDTVMITVIAGAVVYDGVPVSIAWRGSLVPIESVGHPWRLRPDKRTVEVYVPASEWTPVRTIRQDQDIDGKTEEQKLSSVF
jgi:zona occludens toxin (predicted ATPase)